MTVFKTFLKVLKKSLPTVIIYTVILLFFGIFNFSTSDNNVSFTASKPDILIINNDEDEGITKSLINYLTENSVIKDIEDNDEAILDAIFYRDVNYIISIPQNFNKEFLNGNNPIIEVKSTGDYNASLANMMLERYLNVANTYNNLKLDANEKVKLIESTLASEVDVEMTTKLDTSALEKTAFYFNFMNYSLLAGAIFVICLILSSFKNEMINKRTIISSINYQKYNRILLLGNGLFILVLWAFYILISFILVGKIMFTWHGLLYILNSFIFSLCALCLAFLISSIVKNKDAINGIVNVIALGSSFLCGAFVPMAFLPDAALKIAHVLPSYWFIKTNESIKGLELINLETLKPIFISMLVVISFSVVFVILSNIISAKKRKS